MAKIDDSVKKKVPELRFPGFTDDWEERKLNENVENIGTGRSSFKAGLDYSEQTPYEVLGSTSVISYSDSFDHSGNFVLTARVGANAGNLYKHSGNVKISDNTVYIQSKNLEFIFYLLRKYDLKKLAFGTGQPLIKASELKNLKLFFPKTFGEQQKIGSFFKQLDETIALHQRKLDLLKEQKKGYLQKMFPKNGAKVPELRFAGFADDWEERKLGELGSVAMNKRIFKDQTSEIGDIPFFKIGTFGGEADAYISRKLYEEYKQKYPYPKVGDILISASGSIGRTVVYQGEEEYFQDSNIVWLNHDERLNNRFLKQFYSIVTWQGLEGSTIKRLYNKNILETKISIPTPNEQEKIGLFFEKIDDTIDLHQFKLDLLKEQKKGFLQKMFV
ncbi:restriction endonuclease subunit S [Lactococcus lactis]|uniref:restriction endonuclease subunit S n=1 Tax=Lactococcus lactis TaxID=1358 RepID=UPI0025A1E4FA|nr:restriction endonuclease subunit S [Lactococcus lactis]MDM7652549.1 restriction endonuclease subunit S [Lactococcus lactis]